jgi:hypothetical protein
MNTQDHEKIFNKIRDTINDLIIQTTNIEHLADVNICCNCDEKQIILNCACKIQNMHPTYSLINIISSLIYAYFSLNLAEQSIDNTDFDFAYQYLKWNHKQINKQQFKTIYYNIGCSDELVYQDIRRCLLGLNL